MDRKVVLMWLTPSLMLLYYKTMLCLVLISDHLQLTSLLHIVFKCIDANRCFYHETSKQINFKLSAATQIYYQSDGALIYSLLNSFNFTHTFLPLTFFSTSTLVTIPSGMKRHLLLVISKRYRSVKSMINLSVDIPSSRAS